MTTKPCTWLAFAAYLAGATTLANAFFIMPPVDPRTYAREYVNVVTGQYVVLTDASEIANGRAGTGWQATGHSFVVADSGGVPTCRFYAPSVNSHFLTANAAECEALKAPGTGWIFEKIAFSARTPGPAGCGSGDIPVYRLYVNRGRPIHRYVPQSYTRKDLLEDGWIDEGIAFCSEKVEHLPERSVFFGVQPAVGPSGQCPAAGACIALEHLARMDRLVSPYLPIAYIDRNPGFPLEAAALTGGVQDLYTSVTSSSAAEVLAHSYVGAGGLHLQSRDRLGGDYAAMRVAYRPPANAAPLYAGAESRPADWRDGMDRDINFGVSVRVRMVERAAGSHAYGHHSLVFRDTRSGRRIEVTVQAFGTMAAGDFVAADAANGRVIVSTVFRADPLFGEANGSYVDCSSACSDEYRHWSFWMKRRDMARVIGLARERDPSLSNLVADYALDSVDFKVETFKDARLAIQFIAGNLTTWAN
jgi:hypothetical protein